MGIKVYLKPTCTSCQRSLEFLKEHNVPFETIDLFKTPLGENEIRALLRKLGLSPREVLRKKDPAYKELGLDSTRKSDEQLIRLMAQNPGLIQRPIVADQSRAVIARPADAAAELLSIGEPKG